MADRRGGRQRFNPKAGFRQSAKDESSSGVHAAIIKQARQSGQLNLSGRGLATVPDAVWQLNIDVPEEAKSVSLDNTEDRWWEQVELTKLILASNTLTTIADGIANFSALVVLDAHDNNLDSLPSAVGSLQALQKLDISRNKLVTLPDCVGQLRNLVSLHCEHNLLSKLCDGLENLCFMEDLDISNNQLTNLPRSIGYLTKLTKLNIANNKIQRLIPEIGNLVALRQFEATHNEITTLPGEFGNLSKLEILYLRHNKLQAIPVLPNCTSLKELHLGNNAIEQLTAEHLKHLTSISVLDIRDNKVSNLPEEITLLHGLQRLDVTNNNLTGLPYALGTLPQLNSIVLDGNPMKGIRRDIIMRGTQEIKKYLCSRMEVSSAPATNGQSEIQSSKGQSGVIGGGEGINAHEVGQFKNLDYSKKQATDVPADVWELASKSQVTSLNLSKNCFTQLPQNMIVLSKSLAELNLGFNKLMSLHQDISMYQGLILLDLRNNSLTDLPSGITSLQALRELNLACNRFSTIPGCIYELQKLEILFANDNKVDIIDAQGIQRLAKLGTLDLQNNNLTQIPAELGNCTQIKSLQLGGNPCRNPRAAIIAKGTLAILEYLRGRIVVS